MIFGLVGHFIFFAKAEKPEPKIKQRVFVHYPKPDRGGRKPPKPPKPPGPPAGPVCTIGPGVEDWNNYSLAGWSMSPEGIHYKINVSTAPKKISGLVSVAINQASGTWQAEDPQQKFFNDGSTGTRTARYDGQNVIAWKGLDSSAIAITYIWYRTDTNQLVEADMMFNKNLPWDVSSYSSDCIESDAYDVQNIATHEFGHWVGLDDLYDSLDSELTMYGYGALGELKKDTLGTGDINGAWEVAP